MNRQQFLRTALFGVLPVVMRPSVLSAPQRAPDQGPWLPILQHALMCPSVHNIQPWKVRIDSASQATVFFESDKQIPYSDKQGAFMTITMSMFVQTIVQVAAVMGFSATAKFEPYASLPINQGLVAFAAIHLEASVLPGCMDVSALYTRRTARFGYKDLPVDEQVLASLSALVKQGGHRFSYTTDEVQIGRIRYLDVEAMFDDLYDDAYRNELGAWIRTGDGDLHARDGLSARCFGQPDGITRNFFDKHQRYTSDLKKQLLKAYYRHSLKHTRTIFWLSGDFDAYEHWLQCGRTLLGFWLQLASLNIYIQPFGNLVTNAKAHDLLTKDLIRDEAPWFIGRMGYCDTPPPSVRKTVQTICVR